MSFAQEIRDFTTAFKAMNDALGDPLDRASKQADIDWKNAQRDKWRWDMGAEDRERQDIIDFGATSEIPWGTQPTFQPNASGNYQPAALEQAFADTESMGGDWGAVGPQTKYGRAYGKYQVLEPNVAPWTAKYYGQSLTPQQFLTNKDAQQAVFHGEMGRMVSKYGNLQDAMSEWFTGVPYAQAVAEGRRDQNMGVTEYVDRISNAYSKYAKAMPAAKATGTDIPPVQVADASGGSAVPGIKWAPGHGSASGAPAGVYPSYWDETQTAAAQGVDPNLMRVVTRASELSGVRLGMNATTVEGIETAPGLRTPEQQKVFREKGWSKTDRSKHLKGRATDLVPLDENGRPVDPASITDEQWNAINKAMMQASKELGVPVEWGGNWTGFVDKPHYQLPDSYVGEEFPAVASVPGVGDTDVTPTLPYDEAAKDDQLGIEIPAGEEAAPAVPEAPGAAVSGGAGTSTLAGGGGFDPLPQTSGEGFDAVQRANNENMNPAAARRVARGEGDNINIRKILQGAFGFAKKSMGGTNEAVATGPNKIDQAVMSGAGAAPPSLVRDMEKAIDPNNEMPEALRHIRAIQKIYNYYRLAGNDKKANMAAFSLAQTYRGMANQMLGIAQNAAEGGDVEGAIQAFQEAYSLVPDGTSLNVETREDGTFKVDTIDDETGKVTTSRVMSARDIMAQIMQITPAEFDTMILKPSTGVGGEGEDVSGGLELYEETMGDEAVSEGAPPDAEVTPDVPDATPLPHPGQTNAPMGTTTIPPDAAGVETAGGIQVASLDPSIPVAGTDEAVPTTPDTGGGTAEAVPTTPTGASLPSATDPALQVNPNPRKPPPVEKVDAITTGLRQQGKEQAAQIVEARYARDVKIWEEYVKNLRTAEDQATIDAYNEFYTLLGAADENQRFDPPEDLYRRIGNATIVNSMREAANAHNTIAGKLGDEATLQLSAQALQSLTEQYIPSQAIKGVEGPDSGTPGPLGFMFDAAWGAPTEIEGGVAQPGEMVDWPRLTEEDPRVLLLNKADRDAFEQRIKDYNAATTTQNKAWGPGEPLPLQDMATADAMLKEADAAAQAAINNNPDPAVKAASTEHYTNIKNLGHISNVKGAAQTMLTLPRNLNPGMNPEVAFNSALAFAMPNPTDPRRADYQGIRVKPSDGVPAGLVRIVDRSDGSTIAVLPEQTFRDLDRIRIQMAEAYIRKHEGAAMAAATGAAADADLAATTQQRIEQQQRDEAMGGLGYGLGMPENALTAPSLQELEMMNR